MHVPSQGARRDDSGRSTSAERLNLNDDTDKKVFDAPAIENESNESLPAAVESTFATISEALHYKPMPEYEGLHRWDPEFEWEEAEEKAVLRKIDLRVCSFACITFFALQLDRGNLVQALSDNLLEDLNINTNDYNTGQTIFYLCFLFAELPSQLISKKLGPERWIPIQMVSWSLVASCQAFMTGKTGFFVTRALLGAFEGGFIPDTILFLSYWYKSKELPVRLSYFWVSYQGTSIVGAFLAFGFLRLRGHGGQPGWKYLFAFEGMITGLIGIFAAGYMPPSPTQTKGFFRGKNGWFSEREEKIMVNRVIRDDPSKGDMHNRQGLGPMELFRSFSDYDMWPIYLLGLTWLIPPHPATTYLTLQLKSVGFDTFQTNLLTIPAYVLFIIQLLFWTRVSERINQRLLLGVVAEVWNLVMCIALKFLPSNASPWSRWALTTLLVASPYTHAIMVAITSRNAGSVRTRTVASAFYNMCVQASSIIGSNIYREDDKPFYRVGNTVLIALSAYNIILFILAKLYYVWRNNVRAQTWDAMTPEEKDAYLLENKDKGNKRLDFRFTH
ncbi:hypothetical protein FQN55_004357 [Onygenales sp. PD_40]|nr:hypothetical protein FQN55_004357 [Onygenales sp. PD_40]